MQLSTEVGDQSQAAQKCSAETSLSLTQVERSREGAERLFVSSVFPGATLALDGTRGENVEWDTNSLVGRMKAYSNKYRG